jgi:hypothetical protein
VSPLRDSWPEYSRNLESIRTPFEQGFERRGARCFRSFFLCFMCPCNSLQLILSVEIGPYDTHRWCKYFPKTSETLVTTCGACAPDAVRKLPAKAKRKGSAAAAAEDGTATSDGKARAIRTNAHATTEPPAKRPRRTGRSPAAAATTAAPSPSAPSMPAGAKLPRALDRSRTRDDGGMQRAGRAVVSDEAGGADDQKASNAAVTASQRVPDSAVRSLTIVL